MIEQEPTSSSDSTGTADREDLLRQLAHNLRNHLYVIGLSAAVLRKKVVSEADFDELINCITNEHKQAVAALDEVLKVARCQ